MGLLLPGGIGEAGARSQRRWWAGNRRTVCGLCSATVRVALGERERWVERSLGEIVGNKYA